MSEADLFHDAIKYGEAASHLRRILVTLPDICIDRLTAEPCEPECAYCRKTIHGGLRNDAETEAEAVERILYHLSNLDCDGAVQLRRLEAARTLAGLGVQV